MRNAPDNEYLSFNLGGFRVDYSSDDPRWPEVVAAVTGDSPVQVWVSTQQETLLPRRGWVPLYQLSVEGTMVVRHSEVLAHKQ